MADGQKKPDTFASLYLGGRRGAGRKAAQTALFPALDAPAPAAAVVPDRRVWTVRDLVGEIRLELERRHLSVWVEGEISNCRPAASGHLYFTLKDGEAQLPVVLFRREAQALGFVPKDGDAVEVRGRLSVYEPRGQLQMIADWAELRGKGALELAFQRLKARLRAEGLFDRAKRPLPLFPKCLGVVSSRHGAVIRDIVQVGRRRHACLNVLLYPAAMQGADCPAEVAAGIRWFNLHRERVDVILLARGGGSAEDLAGFNDEGLARAIAASALPVVSAIGHETDFTIADFVADLRAATPSAAAELVTAAQHRVEDRVVGLAERVARAGRFQVMQARQQMARLSVEGVLGRMRSMVGRREQRVDELRFRLEAAGERRLRVLRARAGTAAERLARQDPGQRLVLATMRLRQANEALERTREAIVAVRAARVRLVGEGLRAAGERRLRFLGTQARALTDRLGRQDPAQRLALAKLRLLRANEALKRGREAIVAARAVHVRRASESLRATGGTMMAARTGRLGQQRARLEALSPVAVLSRGYALVYGPAPSGSGGRLLRDAAEVEPGEQLRVRLAAGELVARIEERLA